METGVFHGPSGLLRIRALQSQSQSQSQIILFKIGFFYKSLFARHFKLYLKLLPYSYLYSQWEEPARNPEAQGLAGLLGIYFVFYAKWTSLLFTFVYGVAGNVGTIVGAHRLWSHSSFKATLPLQILLMLFHSNTMSMSAIWWVQNHRRHHKYSDTDGDPHNSTRGFFFAHCGWLLVDRHPECVKRRKFTDISDVMSNPVLMFQKRNPTTIFTMAIVLPMAVLVWGCGESWISAWHINMLRIVFLWNAAFMINSFAHLYGNRPYDKNVIATQNLLVSLCAIGEGFHNYHHTFPWDYRLAELGNKWLNFSTLVIDFFAKIGWAYDLQTVHPDIVAKRAARTGDGTDSWGFKALKYQEY